MGVIEDISARIEAEQKLEKLEQRHRFLLEGQRDVVFTADVDGMVTYCSPNALSFAGYEVDDIIGRNVTEFFVDGETLLPGLMKLVVEATARDESVTFEVEYISASGRHFPVEVIAKGILIDGRLQEIHGVKRDISDRKQAEEERKRLEEQVFHSQKLDSLGVLAGGIAHDFNNLLVGILGNADLALNSLPQEAAERSELEAIEVAARRASELCDNMLAYSGKGSFIKKLVTLNDIVEEVSGMIKASIPKKITLSFNLDPDLPLVEADVSQMRQIVMNLMINGAEAIGDRVGMVAVTTGTKYCDSRSLSRSYMLEELEEGEYCYLSVRDSGSGMDEELI